MAPDIAPLANRLTDLLGSTDNPSSTRWLFRPLLELLAHGQPVTTEQLADATASTVDQMRAALATMPDTEYDDRGRIIGNGLTLRPTPHRFELDGHQLYTWCALDTLIFESVKFDRAREDTLGWPHLGVRWATCGRCFFERR